MILKVIHYCWLSGEPFPEALSNNIMIFSSKIFASSLQDETTETVTIHCCMGSWRDYTIMQRCVRKLKKNVCKILKLK